LFAAQCVDLNGDCVGVAIAGNPSRVWQGQAKLVIQRVATQGYENACSALYGSLCRAAKALGYREVWTYTLPDEPGTSLRAAGFMDMGLTDGGEWTRPSRARAPARHPEPKRRWLRKLAGNRIPISLSREQQAMTQRMSENQKVIWICLLFPLFLPFLPVVVLCMGLEKIRHAYWGWQDRRADRREARKGTP
jgi:hypothetical protein